MQIREFRWITEIIIIIIIINLFGDEGQKINYTYIILYKKYFNPKTFSVVAHA